MKIKDIPILLSCYSSSNIESSILSLSVEQYHKYGHPICVVSHKLINRDLENKINYFIYSKENYKLPQNQNSNFYYYFTSDNFKYQTNFNGVIGEYSYAILLNILNGLRLLKTKGHSFFIYSETDTIIDYKSYSKLLEYFQEFNFEYNNSWFLTESIGYDNTTPLIGVTLFLGEIDFFIKKLEKLESLDNYVKYCNDKYISYSAEAVFTELFWKENKRCILVNKKINEVIQNDFVGCLSNGQLIINNFKTNDWWIDIVKRKDTNEISCLISPSKYEDLLTIEIFLDDNLVNEESVMTSNGYVYFLFNEKDFNHITFQVKKNESILRKISRSKYEILNNPISYVIID